jgi:iron(III) transport system ATP-binding protein
LYRIVRKPGAAPARGFTVSINIRNARKLFDGFAAVDGVSAEIKTGEFFVVLGPSGCGKSTLLRLVAGLEEIDGGEIALLGQTVSALDRHVAPEDRTVGVVFQSYALWPHMTVLDNVAFPISTKGASRRAAVADAWKHLRTVALESFAHRKPAELSGGQQQRVALARCLAGQATTVLMDEPLANLDPHLRASMETELSAFHRKANATTFYITHDQREAMALADRIAVMNCGRFEQIGCPQDVHDQPASEHVARFIGRSAILDCIVTHVSGTSATVRMAPEWEVALRCRRGAGLGHARAVLRPQDVQIAGEGAADSLPAEVAGISYRGGLWEVDVRVEGLAQLLPAVSNRRLNIGENLRARLVGGWVLPDR